MEINVLYKTVIWQGSSLTLQRCSSRHHLRRNRAHYESKVQTVLKSTKLIHEHTIYLRITNCMHVYCVLRGVKRPDIVKEMFMFALFHWNQREPNLHIGCHKIYIQ